MTIEVSAAVLSKALTPVVSTVINGLAARFADRKMKWNAVNSVSNLTSIILNINTVKTMWSRDKGVNLTDFYYPPRLVSKASSRAIQGIKEVVAGRCVIEGIVGQGKSILMRNLCNEILSRGNIPIFIELRMVSSERALTELILDYLDSAGIKGGKDVLDFLAAEGLVTLVLDGFDEVPDNMVTSTIYAIQHYEKKYPDLPLIVSSRPHYDVQRLGGFQNYAIKEFEAHDYEPFLKKLIGDVILRENIYQALRGAPGNIQGVITTPLMLTLLCLVYEMESHIPSSLPDFFNSLFQAVFSRHDRFKPGFQRERHSGLGESKLQRLFDAFCFMAMQLDFGRTMTEGQFRHVFYESLNYVDGISCDIEGFRKDITRVACLMLEDGFDQISFLHKSILEYHAASFVKSSSDETAEEFYSLASEDIQCWEEVLGFLRYIDEFRYGKYYVLQHYPAELEQITSVLKLRDPSGVFQYLNQKLPGFQMRMSGTQAVGFEVETIVPMFGFHYLLTDLIEGNARDAIKAADGQAIYTAIRATKASQPGTLGINLKSLLSNIKPDGILYSMEIVAQAIQEELSRFDSIIGSERKKLKMLRPLKC
ncbi:NACHT domain-containing protein [Pseudomonas putida]